MFRKVSIRLETGLFSCEGLYRACHRSRKVFGSSSSVSAVKSNVSLVLVARKSESVSLPLVADHRGLCDGGAPDKETGG